MRGEPRRAGRSRESDDDQAAAPASGGGGEGRGAAGNLAETMAQVARAMREEHGDVEATLQVMATTAVRAVPGAEDCSISYVTGRERVEPRASTGDLPARVDDLQTRVRQGPCLDSVWEQETVRIDDMRREARWPRFAAGAVELGALSALCFQLFVEGDNLGALNLYARRPDAFDEESEDVGLVLAAHAAVALAGARGEEDLRRALGSRDTIGQAKGILMERHRLTAQQAFEVLARASQQSNRKLVDVAEELTQTGAVPGPD
ncbi:GAF domain-containing protein [Geodermatophilus pulveris]|uniref:GAF domain-containing protein n=1 Tax=Geodermatophilus pulveris TaxID=1564159 RepID=A0A239AN69_9ACTN|nr:GAF and ANTAR domain-containing protein [Geodermatophilus pulveris]SNR97126.1 GAF domain-containing protein [Geodermatophilus pulveris]